MKKISNAVENYFQTVIKKSWTWDRLTEEEQKRFIDLSVFDRICGSDKQRIKWLCTIYEAFLNGVGYDGFQWREEANEK